MVSQRAAVDDIGARFGRQRHTQAEGSGGQTTGDEALEPDSRPYSHTS